MARYGYLSHHGIEGQKWGRRNGPPYPLAPGAHSAEEKRKTGGHYSQGVKQDRSGGSSGGGGGSSNYNSQEAMERRFMEEQAKKDKRKKIAKAVAVGVGLTAATAAVAAIGTAAIAGGIGIRTLKANPDTTNAVLNGIGQSIVGTFRDMKKNSANRSTILNDTRLSSAEKSSMLKTQKEFVNKARSERNSNLWNVIKNARNSDKERRNILPIDLNKVNSDADVQDLIRRAGKNPRLIQGKQDAIIDKFGPEQGGKILNDISVLYKRKQNSGRQAGEDASNYANTHGVRGAINNARWLYRTGSNAVGTGKKVVKGVGTAAGVAGGLMGLNTAASRANQYYQQQPNNQYYRQPNNQYYQQQNNYNQNRQPRYEYYYDSKGRVQRRAK